MRLLLTANSCPHALSLSAGDLRIGQLKTAVSLKLPLSGFPVESFNRHYRKIVRLSSETRSIYMAGQTFSMTIALAVRSPSLVCAPIRENGSQGVIPYLALNRRIHGSTTIKSSLQCSKDSRGRAGFMPRASVGSV
jgi:hypothetical protein